MSLIDMVLKVHTNKYNFSYYSRMLGRDKGVRFLRLGTGW